MSALKIAILVALLFGLAWLLGCNHKDTDEQQPSVSKTATDQQAVQPPTQTSEADEGEEGPATPAAQLPNNLLLNKPRESSSPTTSMAIRWDSCPRNSTVQKLGEAPRRNGLCRLTQLPPQNRTLSLKLQQTKLTTVSLY
jgi:hypothetical protein